MQADMVEANEERAAYEKFLQREWVNVQTGDPAKDAKVEE